MTREQHLRLVLGERLKEDLDLYVLVGRYKAGDDFTSLSIGDAAQTLKQIELLEKVLKDTKELLENQERCG